jgi:hypothetical protein
MSGKQVYTLARAPNLSLTVTERPCFSMSLAMALLRVRGQFHIVHKTIQRRMARFVLYM